MLFELLRALPIDVADDVLAAVERLHHRAARRAVAIAEDDGVLQELALRHHLIEFRAVDEMVMLAVDLAGALRPRRHRDRHRELTVLLEELAADRRLARARWRGQDEKQTAALDRGLGHRRYSMFCTCSRNCSIAALSARPMRVSSRSADFEHSVLASRLNSWQRKSNRLPMAPPSFIRLRAASRCAWRRSSSSRISALAMTSAASCARRSSGSAGTASVSAAISSLIRALIAAGCVAAASSASFTSTAISSRRSVSTASSRMPS